MAQNCLSATFLMARIAKVFFVKKELKRASEANMFLSIFQMNHKISS